MMSRRVQKRPMLLDMRSAPRHLLIGLVVMAVVTAPWSLISVANLRLSPQVPWAIPTGLTYVGLLVAACCSQRVNTAEARP